MTAIAWTGRIASSADAPLPDVPASQCIWKQQNFGRTADITSGFGDSASLDVTWEHGNPPSMFHDSNVCPPNQTRSLLVVASDPWANWGDNMWHNWHNVLYLTFTALLDSGILTCDEATGACATSIPFDFLHIYQKDNMPPHPGLCAVVKQLFGQAEGGWCSTRPRELHHLCYERVIMQASTLSNPNIYTSGNGTSLRLFARAVESLSKLPPLTPKEVETRPAHIVFLGRRLPDRRPGFSQESLDTFFHIMNNSGIPFTIVFCREATKAEDIAILRKATVVIGATGAAFTNTWHLTKGAVAVLAMTGKPWFETWYFKAQVLNTGSTFIRWVPTQQNYTDPAFGLMTPFPYQNHATWITVLRTALLQQDTYALAHPRVVEFLKASDNEPAPDDRRCHAMLMVYKPKNRMY